MSSSAPCAPVTWAVLGIPPTWYKSFEYRARVVRDPRGVLKEFGLELGDDVEVCVWDSTAEIRAHGPARTPSRHRDAERSGACRPRLARFDGRHRQGRHSNAG